MSKTKRIGTIRCLSREGDTKLSWNADNEFEVANAREMFNKLVRDGNWSAFMMKWRGGTGEKITEFDPNAAKIILVPPIGGG